MAPTDLTMMKNSYRDRLSLDHSGYDMYPGTGAYGSPYLYSSAINPIIPDCLSSGDPNEQIYSLIHVTTFVDQVTGDMYRYNHDNKLVILLEGRDCDIAEELQNILDNKSKSGMELHPHVGLTGFAVNHPFCI